MSILSDLLNGKITFGQAVTEGGQWFSAILAKAPPEVQSDVAAGLSDFKQAASNAVMLADTALGPILAVGTVAVESAANVALTSIAGPAVAGQISPGLDAALSQGAAALKAEIDAVAAQVRAKILGATAPQ